MRSISAADTTEDAFLGGRVLARQPRCGHRSGLDAVLLAAAVPARPGQGCLELGTGVGVAALCLIARVPGVAVTGVELHPHYAALATTNAADLPFEVVEADLAALPADLRQRRFDHVLMNPPFFDRSRSPVAADPGRDLARGGPTPLGVWLDVGARRLAPGGWLTLIQRIERLPEVLAGLSGRLGSIAVAPLAARQGRAPDRFLLRARRDGRADFRLLPGLVLHDGPRHLADAEDYSPEVQRILRDAAAFPWGD